METQTRKPCNYIAKCALYFSKCRVFLSFLFKLIANKETLALYLLLLEHLKKI